jgi:thymidylate synthase (FAD)
LKAELIDSMGSDLTVVNAARVSFDKESYWQDNHGVEAFDDEPIKFLQGKDQKLINYLAAHNHWTPFSHVMITMRETVPIFVARQRFKHMVGFTYNEVSRRYVDDTPEFFFPDKWRKAAENKKQGSSDENVGDVKSTTFLVLDEDIYYSEYISACTLMYNSMLDAGVAPEQARMVLPQSMYTSYYTTGSLAAWARAYKLRSDEHSQKEIQNLAAQWHQIIGGIPELEHSWRALTNKED